MTVVYNKSIGSDRLECASTWHISKTSDFVRRLFSWAA